MTVWFATFCASRLDAQIIEWDAIAKEHVAKPGETNAHLSFTLTNISANNVTITGVRPSCGCSAVNVPALPWSLAPGSNGTIGITTDLRGKRGTLSKSVFAEISDVTNALTFNILIPPEAESPLPPGLVDAEAPITMGDRNANQELAMADRQAVFKGNCAECHAVPAAGRNGKILYIAVCAICHASSNRATMVPDLRTIPHSSDPQYWRKWIAEGREKSLMPAFTNKAGGPLTDEQIESLVEYLIKPFPTFSR